MNKDLNEVVTKTATKWKERAKRDRANRKNISRIHNAKLPVSGWHYFSSQKPKLNSDLEIVWSDGTEDIFRWIKPNIEQIDFDVDCRPIKWRYACH